MASVERTHWEGCWMEHPECKAKGMNYLALAERLDELNSLTIVMPENKALLYEAATALREAHAKLGITMQSWKRDAAEVERLRALLREAKGYVLGRIETPDKVDLYARIDAELSDG